MNRSWDIKWRRDSKRVSNAAENYKNMQDQLLREAYSELKPGQLVRVRNDINLLGFIKFSKGDILMYLKWAENEPLDSVRDTEYTEWSENLTDGSTTVTGPVWLFNERIHYKRLDPKEIEIIDLDELAET